MVLSNTKAKFGLATSPYKNKYYSLSMLVPLEDTLVFQSLIKESEIFFV
jgi:hypothetical protein